MAQISENNPYRHVDNRWKRPSYELDVPKLARDLVKELGLKDAVVEHDERTLRCADILSGEFKLCLTHDKGDFIRVSAAPARWDPDVINLVTFPSTRLNSTRDRQQIAAAIRSRVVDKASEPLQKVLALRAEKHVKQQHLDAIIADLTARFPTLDVTKSSSGVEASLFNRGSGVYFTGSIRHDGSLNIDRVGSLQGDRGLAVLAAILQPKEAST